MLLSLHVKNLALIEEAEVEFGPGLNILSGETGAGKSILIGSVNLALGGKAQKDLLREGAQYALVELAFSVDQPHQLQTLRELDVEPEDGQVIMTRRLLANGRSVCRINSETVSAAMMRKTASLLIDIHGQHEHQSLRTGKNHIRFLDARAKKELNEKKERLASCYHTYTECRRLLEESALDEDQQKRELSFLQYEIDEIGQAALQPGEDEQLEADFRRLSHGRKILEALAECRELCSDGRGSVSEMLGRAVGPCFRLRNMMSRSAFWPGSCRSSTA